MIHNNGKSIKVDGDSSRIMCSMRLMSQDHPQVTYKQEIEQGNALEGLIGMDPGFQLHHQLGSSNSSINRDVSSRSNPGERWTEKMRREADCVAVDQNPVKFARCCLNPTPGKGRGRNAILPAWMSQKVVPDGAHENYQDQRLFWRNQCTL